MPAVEINLGGFHFYCFFSNDEPTPEFYKLWKEKMRLLNKIGAEWERGWFSAVEYPGKHELLDMYLTQRPDAEWVRGNREISLEKVCGRPKLKLRPVHKRRPVK